MNNPANLFHPVLVHVNINPGTPASALARFGLSR
jgi:hypothetical protein